MKINLIDLLGWLSIFCSALCFYFSTVIIRWSAESATIDPAFFAIVRFILGFIIVCVILKVRGRQLMSKNYHLLIGRAIFNCLAVYSFYKAVTCTSVAEANILNMTYPLFIVLFSWVFLKPQRDGIAVLMVMVAFSGVWLVLSLGKIDLNMNNLWGLFSGVNSAAALIYLNISRRHHDSHTILFFMFGIGTIVMVVFFYDRFFIPDSTEAYYLMLCAISGILGQYLITIGFRYVTAVEGSIISSTRILLAAICGPFLVADPPLSTSGWVGALLIFIANVVLTIRKKSVPE